jgi:hypothetical protein
LLAGWLASRLDWRPRQRDGERWELLTARDPVELEISEAGSSSRGGAPECELLCVELHAAGGTCFRVEADPRHPGLVVAGFEPPSASPAPKSAPLRSLDAENELARRLQRMRRSTAFEAALAAAAQLLSTRDRGARES